MKKVTVCSHGEYECEAQTVDQDDQLGNDSIYVPCSSICGHSGSIVGLELKFCWEDSFVMSMALDRAENYVSYQELLVLPVIEHEERLTPESLLALLTRFGGSATGPVRRGSIGNGR